MATNPCIGVCPSFLQNNMFVFAEILAVTMDINFYISWATKTRFELVDEPLSEEIQKGVDTIPACKMEHENMDVLRQICQLEIKDGNKKRPINGYWNGKINENSLGMV